MARFLADHNFSGRIVRGLLRRDTGLDLITAREAGLARTPDPEVLAWAAREGRVVLSHDRKTMTRYADDRIGRGDPMPGLVIADPSIAIGLAI